MFLASLTRSYFHRLPSRAALALIIALFGLAGSGVCAAEDLVPQLAPYKGPSRNDVDATTIKGKVMCGYQMWFSTKGDGIANRYGHWSKDGDRVAADTLTVEMWPDMTDYPKSERMPVEGMKHKDGSQAYLYSSARPMVVDLHFKWMKRYGIDGVFVQRFVIGCEHPNSLGTSGPLARARWAANKYGRVFSITYDLSGTPADKAYDMLVNDWKFLVDQMQITKDKRFLHQGGKPVLSIYGFFPDRFGPDVANKIIDFFKNDPKYGTFLIGSGAWYWREVKDPGWPEVYRRFDAMLPWNVGNHGLAENGKDKIANTNPWADDMAECRKYGIMYMPVAYPGFSWDNLQRAYGNLQNVGSPLLRRGGAFLWEQFAAAAKLKVDAIFVAMLDEVDEGTAIFKVTNDPPVGAHFLTYDGKPSDWYLRLTGYATKMLRGKVPLKDTMPENP